MDERARLEARIVAAGPNTIPMRAQLPEAARISLFVAEAERLAASVDCLPDLAAVPDAVAAFLSGLNLPAEIRVSPDRGLADIPWSARPLLQVSFGRALSQDLVSVTGCFAGIAETGTVMTLSAAERPATLNFMPDNHIVVLHRRDIVGPMEEAFARLRAHAAENSGGAETLMPRTVNLISGPSRTADIDSQLVMGAHGPRRLHILLVGAIEVPQQGLARPSTRTFVRGTRRLQAMPTAGCGRSRG